MYNWGVDIRKLDTDTKAGIIWRLEQAINFGLNGKKLTKSLVKKYWQKLRIDPARKSFLTFLLWPKKF